MTPSEIDRICIDVDDGVVSLGQWDGRAIRCLRIDGDPVDAVSEGLRRLDPRPRFILRYRLSPDDAVEDDVGRRIEVRAREAGASAVRRLPLDLRADPGNTAARQAADRHRLGAICCLEQRAASISCAVVDARGAVAAHVRRNGTDRAAIDEALARVQRVDEAPTLVRYGIASTAAMAIDVARRGGFGRVLIPDHAESLSTVGMFIVDLALNLRMAVEGWQDERRIREGFARLMDDAARQVTLEGYDIDDTICERMVEGSGPDDRAPLETYLRAPFAARALAVRVTIQTPKFALPPDGTAKLIAVQAFAG